MDVNKCIKVLCAGVSIATYSLIALNPRFAVSRVTPVGYRYEQDEHYTSNICII